jgi:HEAT repeat protein
LRDAAAALGLLREREVAARLIALLPDASSALAQAALAQALGVLGERSALAPLARLVADRNRPGLARAFAAVALGRVADRDPEPWSLPYSAGVLFTDAPRTLLAREGDGVLNIL